MSNCYCHPGKAGGFLILLSPSGALILDFPLLPETRLRYSPWALGLSVERWEAGRWVVEALDPGIPLLHAVRSANAGEPIHEFVAQFPREVRSPAEEYVYLQTSLLQWIATRPAAAELFAHVPTLLLLLIVAAQEAGWSAQRIERVLSRRCSEILERLTGIRSEAAVKFIHRIRLLHGDRRDYALILDSLDSGHGTLWREFSQWPVSRSMSWQFD